MNTKCALTVGTILCMSALAMNTASALPPANRNDVVGTWVNVNPATGGIVKVVIANDATGFKIHTFGACSPTPCDLGTILASPFSKSGASDVAEGVTGSHNLSFATMLVIANRVFDIDGGNFLNLNTFTRFAPRDPRKDYTRSELFIKR
jgi:hypothetical protein